jgi:hypothetical protein
MLLQLLLYLSSEIMCKCSTMLSMACKTHTHANIAEIINVSMELAILALISLILVRANFECQHFV